MQNKKNIIYSVIAILALFILLIGATFAYFQAQGNTGSITETKVTTYTTDTLSFETGDPLTFTIDQENFAEGKGNLASNTYAKAILTANNKTNTATEHYYVYLNISNNTFKYTQNENTPEILLTIKDASGTELTSISGLAYKTVTDGKGTNISGFDITTKNGLIALLSNKEITATPNKTDEWNITITFVNYNADQSANAGNSFIAKLITQKNEVVLLKDYILSEYTGTQGKNSLYYHDSTLVNGAGDNSYRYAGPSDSVNNFVCFGTNESPCPTDNLYRIIGVINDKVKLIKNDYANSNLLGTDGDFNSTSTPSPSYYKGNLTSISVYRWNYNATNSTTNTWSTSLLNKTNLNTNFINNIGEEWANRIAMTTWKVGGNTDSKIGNAVPSIAYQNEIINPDATNSTDNATEYSAKIGLMYVSDYGFAAMPNWTRNMINYTNATINNWLYMGFSEWTISRISDYSDYAFNVYIFGGVSNGAVGNSYGVRPVFNLESSVTYKSGSGTQSDPIIIN